MSSFGAPFAQNLSAGTGTHPFQKTMSPFPLSIIRLVCAFHDTTALYFKIEFLIINNAPLFVNKTQEFADTSRIFFPSFKWVMTDAAGSVMLEGRVGAKEGLRIR
jgi:hypothetical protein